MAEEVCDMVQIGLPCSPEWLCSLIGVLFGLLGGVVILYIACLVYQAWRDNRDN
jgi:hypothetical protein